MISAPQYSIFFLWRYFGCARSRLDDVALWIHACITSWNVGMVLSELVVWDLFSMNWDLGSGRFMKLGVFVHESSQLLAFWIPWAWFSPSSLVQTYHFFSLSMMLVSFLLDMTLWQLDLGFCNIWTQFYWPKMSGVINGTAPNPVRLVEMCEQLGDVLGRPSWLPVPDFALKAVLGEGASVVRTSACPLSLFFVHIAHWWNTLVEFIAGFGRTKGASYQS